MESFNMQKQTLIKCQPPLTSQSIAHFYHGKYSLILISSQKTIKIYNLNSDKFEEELKLPAQSGPVSCITISDDLFFFAYGMHIAASGYNAKIIFDFDTYIAADRIDRIHVIGYRLWVLSGAMINQFVLGGSQLGNKMSRKMPSGNKVEDIRSHMLQAKINSSLSVEDQFSKHYLILLKNNNQITIFEQKQVYSHKTTSPPLCITALKSPGVSGNRYIMGSQSGEITCLQIDKKSVKQILKIGGQIGRINSILIVQNEGIFVTRDGVIELWSSSGQLQASQQVEQTYTSGVYIADKSLITLVSKSGIITQLKDYLQLIKTYQKTTQLKQKQSLQKQIQTLQKQYKELKQKYTKLNPTNPTNPTNINVNNINVDINVSVDYLLFCCCFEIRSQWKIGKVVVKGIGEVVGGSGRVGFVGKIDGGCSVYTIEEEQKNIAKIHYSYLEQYILSSASKLQIIVYLVSEQQKKTYAVNRTIDLKLLPLHHKVGKIELPSYHLLKVSGDFKYFHINTYMNAIFMDFGENGQSGQEWVQVCYESIVGAAGIVVRFRNGECEVQAVNPAPLLLIKQYLVSISKQKNTPINITLQPNPTPIKSHIPALLSLLSPIHQTSNQHKLLPGLYQLQNQQTLTQQLKSILNRKQEIQRKYKENIVYEKILKNIINNFYIGYLKICEIDVGLYDVDAFEKIVEEMDGRKILWKILGTK